MDDLLPRLGRWEQGRLEMQDGLGLVAKEGGAGPEMTAVPLAGRPLNWCLWLKTFCLVMWKKKKVPFGVNQLIKNMTPHPRLCP